jgi:hypothetical protein
MFRFCRGRTSFLPSPVPLAHSPERGAPVPAKELAFYEERQVQPRRLNDSARVCLIDPLVSPLQLERGLGQASELAQLLRSTAVSTLLTHA